MTHSPFGRWLARAMLFSLLLPGIMLSRPRPVVADQDPLPVPTPSIIIEEVAWAGSSLSQADEWIELANIGAATATVGGWSLHGAAPQPTFLPIDATIPPRGTYRISNYPETDEKSSLTAPIHLATTTISLSNSALKIELISASGTIVDLAGINGIPPAGSSSPKATMIRVATSSTDLVGIWTSATSSMGLKEGVSDLAEPGICRLCVIPILEETEDDLTPDEAHEEMPVEEDPEEEPPVEIPVEDLPTDGALDDLPTTTSTADIPETSVTSTPATTTTSTLPTIEPTVTPTIPPPSIPEARAPLHIKLSEAMSNPATGPEWVELKIDEMTATSTDRALELWDASGRITTVAAHTPVTAPGYLVVMLTSAKLNNGGDELSLRETNGIGLDLTTLPALEDGVAWARTESGSWAQTDILTPGSVNRFPVVSQTTIQTTTSVTNQTTASPSSVLGVTTTTSSPANTTTTASPHQNTGAAPIRIALNEIMPAPSSGKEWVELKMDDLSATVTDRALELWDASGKIATIAEGTPVSNPGYLIVTLSSARLNNGGDEVHLLDASGVALDDATTPSLKQDIAWARMPDGSWTDTDILSPGAENVFPASLPESPSSSETDAALTSLLITGTDDGSKPMSSSTDSARVRLVGSVGSVPRLFGATHAFVLLGEDGRGVITYLPKHLNVPTYGSRVRAMGTLQALDRGLELRMKTSDVWVTLAASSTAPLPREVDLLAPAAEDGWSLVAAEGTVREVNARSFHLETEGVDIMVAVPAAAGYRTARLVKGDTVRVTGLLDLRKDEPSILIRTPDDIALLTHAEATVKAPTTSTNDHSFPDWVPFGAAAGAVLATGGVKRLHAFWKRRRLETLAAQTGQATA